MLTREIIRTKRDGKALPPEAIDQLIERVVDGSAGDEQLGALAMAIFLNGMNDDECVALTRAMRDSGAVIDWSPEHLPGPVLDKHSTGGVGDSVSFILGPWVAACGGFVPMISGPGLGHTGGTLDKLKAIPGYDPFPGLERFCHVVKKTGVAIIGQTDELAPADRRLYEIRDVTSTVESIPLIISSILSKKLAAGLNALVLDIKTGSGSVMGSPSRARALSERIIRVAAGAGTPCRVLITDMNQVLSANAGNALEVREIIAVLTGQAPGGRLLEVCRELTAEMLELGGLAGDRNQALDKLERTLESGEVAERFARMVAELGGPKDLLDRPDEYLPAAPVVMDILPEKPGRVAAMDVQAIGMAVVELGGGRLKAGDVIDPAVGLENVASIGDELGQRPLARVHARNRASAEQAAARVRKAIRVTEDTAELPPLIHDRIVGEEN